MENNLKKKIAIVDDETSFLNMFSKILQSAGFETKGFTGPKQALLEIPGEKPDLILLDINMPDMDGFEVFEHLKNDMKENMPKVVFLTNLGETISGLSIDEHFAKSIGVTGYIKKTEDLDVIVKKVKEYLEIK